MYDEYNDKQSTVKNESEHEDLVPGTYKLKTKDGLDASVTLELGAVYAILLDADNKVSC